MTIRTRYLELGVPVLLKIYDDLCPVHGATVVVLVSLHYLVLLELY
jgi:hypothetical protein